MKNALFLSYDGMTDPLGQSQVLPYLKGLSNAGYSIHLISFEKEERFEKHRALIQEICDAANIQWYPQNYTKKPPLLSTMKDVRKMRSVAHAIHKKHTISIVHCRSYISALIGRNMQKKFGTKFLFDMRGFWADERIEGNIWNIKNPLFKLIYSYFKRKELELFKHADHIVSLTENGKNEILSWKGLEHKSSQITVIPCCVDLELFNPDVIDSTKQTELRTSLRISSTDFVLGYVGSIGTWYMLDEMLDFFKVLLESKPSAKFLFVTGEKEVTIRSKAQEKGISVDTIIVTSTLHKEVPIHISLFDYSIFFIRPSFSKKASSPTKQGEIMAMGVPLICNAGVGDTDRIVERYKSGGVLNQMNFENYQNAINTISSDNNFPTETLRQGAHEFFSLDGGIEKYLNVYQLLEM